MHFCLDIYCDGFGRRGSLYCCTEERLCEAAVVARLTCPIFFIVCTAVETLQCGRDPIDGSSEREMLTVI